MSDPEGGSVKVKVKCPGEFCMDGRCSSAVIRVGYNCKGSGELEVDHDPWAWRDAVTQVRQDMFVERYRQIGREMWDRGLAKPRGRRPGEGWEERQTGERQA